MISTGILTAQQPTPTSASELAPGINVTTQNPTPQTPWQMLFNYDITAAGASLLIVDQFVARALEIATWAYVMTRGEITFAGTSTELQDSDVFERYLGASS